MHELWSSASYQPHLLSLAFALAPAALLIVIAYAGAMRGAATLRGFLLGHCVALLPYATVMMLSPSIASPALAERLFRVAFAFIPLASAAQTGFQVALVGGYPRWRWAIWLLVASAAVWLYLSGATAAVVDGVLRQPGFWYARAGRWGWLALLHTVVLFLPGITALLFTALASPPSEERAQLRAALRASLVTHGGLLDVPIAYGATMIPLGWLMLGIGSLLFVRAVVARDLLRVRAVDATAPLLVLYFAAGALLGWVALTVVAAPVPWPLTALVLLLGFLGVRVAITAIGTVVRGARGSDDPLDRLLDRLVGRAREMTSAPAIAQLALDTVEGGLGAAPRVLLASSSDWGWSTPDGRLDDALAPDPLLAGWLAERRDPVFSDDLGPVPSDLRPLLARLLERHGARALIPVGASGELLGLLLIPAASRRIRGPALGFLTQVAERMAEALLHARLALRAAERAALAREVELAATVQAALLPGAGPHVHGAVTVIGSWQPATRCAGDFWTVQPLGPDGPVLIAIGDVTGHGVASAMVTAAAIGACDVCVRQRGATLDLVTLVAALDVAVRRVGGGLAMTCFVAILDPAGRELRFVSSGHAAPYLCRATPGGIDLQALVGRGNPLGTGAEPARVQRRPLEAGDLVVWYTDGLVEARDPMGAPFGDRRLQHLLKKLNVHLTPTAVHDLIQRSVAAHRAGRPPGDDETLVVAQFLPGSETPR